MAGILVLVAFVLSLVASAALLYRKVQRDRPHVFVHGIGVKFLPGADESIKGVSEACQALREVMREYWPTELPRPPHIWIEFYNRDALITSVTAKNGFILGPDGRKKQITGTTDEYRSTPISGIVYVVKVRQMYTTNDVLKPAISTALFHEVAEHCVPLMLTGNANFNHDPHWTQYTHKMEELYRELVAHPRESRY